MIEIEPYFVQIEENPNCEVVDGLVFQPRTVFQPISRVRLQRGGVEAWYEVTGLDSGAQTCPARAAIIDDSGDGSGYLVVGGSWGLRFRDLAIASAWDVSDPSQWGAPLLMLAADGSDLQFA